MTDSVLARVAQGDARAVHECIDQFGSLIWSIARRLTRTRADAEDAVQEIFTDVWRSAGRFDPNQGNYTIDGVLSSRVKGFYVAAVFHHLSRHLADRAKRPPVDWNMFGGRAGAIFKRNDTDVEARVDLLGAILKTNVDYNWEMHAGVRAHHRVYGTFGIMGSAMLREVGTNGLGNRGTQTGGRGEGGFRVSGKAATVELYLAMERVIDPYPTEFGTTNYASVGMRLLTR